MAAATANETESPVFIIQYAIQLQLNPLTQFLNGNKNINSCVHYI